MSKCLNKEKALRVGLGVLASAIAVNQLPTVHDFFKGLLYGIAIACLLIGSYRKVLSK